MANLKIKKGATEKLYPIMTDKLNEEAKHLHIGNGFLELTEDPFLTTGFPRIKMTKNNTDYYVRELFIDDNVNEVKFARHQINAYGENNQVSTIVVNNFNSIQESTMYDLSGILEGFNISNNKLVSKKISDNQSTSSTIILNTVNSITINYTVSSESGWDYFKVYYNGLLIHSDSGSKTTNFTYNSIDSGLLKIEYSKDGSGSSGSDNVTINSITFNGTELKSGYYDYDIKGYISSDFNTGFSFELPFIGGKFGDIKYNILNENLVSIKALYYDNVSDNIILGCEVVEGFNSLIVLEINQIELTFSEVSKGKYFLRNATQDIIDIFSNIDIFIPYNINIDDFKKNFNKININNAILNESNYDETITYSYESFKTNGGTISFLMGCVGLDDKLYILCLDYVTDVFSILEIDIENNISVKTILDTVGSEFSGGMLLPLADNNIYIIPIPYESTHPKNIYSFNTITKEIKDITSEMGNSLPVRNNYYTVIDEFKVLAIPESSGSFMEIDFKNKTITTIVATVQTWNYCCTFGNKDYIYIHSTRNNSIQEYRISTKVLKTIYNLNENITYNKSLCYYKDNSLIKLNYVDSQFNYLKVNLNDYTSNNTNLEFDTNDSILKTNYNHSILGENGKIYLCSNNAIAELDVKNNTLTRLNPSAFSKVMQMFPLKFKSGKIIWIQAFSSDQNLILLRPNKLPNKWDSIGSVNPLFNTPRIPMFV